MTGAAVLAAACVAMAALALGVPRIRARFASLRTAVWLLSFIAALSVVGVVIGQRLPPGAYVERYGAVAGALLVRSGLASVFRSWYFLLTAWALSLSILSCSLGRARALLRSRLQRRRALVTLITHLSIIVIMAGGVLTGMRGFRRPASRFLGSGDVIEVPEGGFSLRVEEARTEFGEGGALSEYVSVVTVIEAGR
jgi:cytochrome c biogenesis protein ResB